MGHDDESRTPDGSQAASFGACIVRVQELVAGDDLEEALHMLVKSPSLPAGLLTSLILLQARIAHSSQSHASGTLTNEAASTERTAVMKAVLDLLQPFEPSRAMRAPPTRTMSPDEVAARKRYLKHVKAHVVNLLRESIHNARFLDLGILDTPVATKLPWGYKNATSLQPFHDISDAMRAYDRRVLLLGGPGSGKTTTLLHIALELIHEADADSTAPIPLIANLSRVQTAAPTSRWSFLGLRGADGTAPASPIDTWLAAELASVPGVSRSYARTWVSEGRVAALLDGLDEVGEERRAELVDTLNKAYLLKHPDSVVIVCTRILEYLPIQERPSRRLQLTGAVTLQPLSKEQVGEYLDAARATGLREALQSDPSLGEMAETPLMLSLMTLAYANRSRDAILTMGSVADKRHHLLQEYVDRMLQRKERRDRRIPFDGDSDKDVKPNEYRYSPRRVDRYLSWLAVAMSVRMQTSVPVRAFHRFLGLGARASKRKLDDWAQRIARASLIPLGVAVMAAPALVTGAVDSLTLLALASALMVATLGHYSYRGGAPSAELSLPAGIVLLALILLGVGATARALSETLPLGMDPIPAGAMAIVGCLAVAFPLGAGRRSWPESLWIPASTLVGACVGGILIHFALVPWSGGLFFAGGMTLAQGVGFWVLSCRENRSARKRMVALGVLGVTGLVIAAFLVGVVCVGNLGWIALIAAAGAAVALILMHADVTALGSTAIVTAVAIGAVLGGEAVAVLGLVGGALAVLFVALANDGWDDFVSTRLVALVKRLSHSTEALVERRLFSPCSLAVVAVGRRLPLRLRYFLTYGGEALILKVFTGDIEFVHRRVRDYFALRELIPQLRSSDPRQRMEAVRALAFQGVAAVDPLVELLNDGGEEERAAAAAALSRIAAPEVADHLAEALARDPSFKVKISVVGSLHRLPREEGWRLLAMAGGAPELSVRIGGSIVAEHLGSDQRTGGDQWRAIALRPVTMGQDAGAIRESLRTLCRSEHSVLRAGSCRLMGHGRDSADFGALFEALRQDTEPVVREAAASALGKLHDSAAIDPLMGALADSDNQVRIASITALGDLRAQEAVSALSGELKSRDVSVRLAVLRALTNIGPLNLAEILVRSLRDRSEKVRYAAAIGLAEVHDERAVRPLIESLELREPISPLSAARALARFGELARESFLALANAAPNGEVRQLALSWLIEMGDPRGPALVQEHLASNDVQARQGAIGILAKSAESGVQAVLSRDLDGVGPWLDPRAPILRSHLIRAAANLSVDPAALRAQCLEFGAQHGLKIHLAEVV